MWGALPTNHCRLYTLPTVDFLIKTSVIKGINFKFNYKISNLFIWNFLTSSTLQYIPQKLYYLVGIFINN